MLSLLYHFFCNENADDEHCATTGERFIYLEKRLFNMDALFSEVDGRHAYVRKWMMLEINDNVATVLPCRLSSVCAEMTALGVQHAVEEHVSAFIKKHCSGDGIEAFLLLVQNTGYFPLAIFFSREEGSTCEISARQAKDLLRGIYTLIILNV